MAAHLDAPPPKKKQQQKPKKYIQTRARICHSLLLFFLMLATLLLTAIALLLHSTPLHSTVDDLATGPDSTPALVGFSATSAPNGSGRQHTPVLSADSGTSVGANHAASADSRYNRSTTRSADSHHQSIDEVSEFHLALGIFGQVLFWGYLW